MSDTVKKILAFIKKRPGLSFIVVILFLIEIVTIRPSLYLFGWDNYSSYFNLGTNIFRTFFATWRDYRGLGVASDSESLDLFRQIFFLITQPFVAKTLVDQLYIISALILGVVSMYLLSFMILKDVLKEKLSETILDIAAAFSALFYLFNLNTTSTFYFPMIMFINRFFSIPLLFLSFLILLKEKHLSRKALAVLVVIFFITSGSYLVATVFITMMIALVLFTYFSAGFKKALLTIVVYCVLSSFWLLPFINYTIEKSHLLPLAPTFIDANESQLNKPKDFFNLTRQSTLYPNFFDTKYTDLKTNTQKSLHPLADKLQEKSWKPLTFLFPLMYLVGAVLILLRYRQKKILWIPTMLGLFLFLSFKEFSPLGFLYQFASNAIPFFKVLFRFGDTKFHTYIAFSGSIASSFVIVFLSEKLHKYAFPLVVVVLIIPSLLLFQSYFKGNLIGPFMFNNIPEPYGDMVKYINNDKDHFRVLHVPYDRNAYWKSYSWGSFGSSFLHFMLNKPLIDKTFEPASMENAYVDAQLRKLVDNTQSLNKEDLMQRVDQLSRFLRKTSVKYIIVDGTVSAELETRDMLLWGSFDSPDSMYLLKGLKEFGYATSVMEKKIGDKTIELLRLKETDDFVTFQPQARIVDPYFSTIVDSDLIFDDKPFIQAKNLTSQSVYYPLKRLDGALSWSGNSAVLTLPDTILPKGSYTIDLPSRTDMEAQDISTMVEITGKKMGDEVVVSFYNRILPLIVQESYREPLGEIRIPYADIGQSKLAVNDMLVSIPAAIDDTEQSLQNLMMRGENLDVQVLRQDSIQAMNLQGFVLTDNPNCFGDTSGAYSFDFNVSEGLRLQTTNGSTCLLQRLQDVIGENTSHIEFILDADMQQQNDGEKETVKKAIQKSSKPGLSRVLFSQDKPQYLQWCVKTSTIDYCYNTNQILELGERAIFELSVDKSVKGVDDLLVLLVLRGLGESHYDMNVHSFSIAQYVSVAEAHFVFDPHKPYAETFGINQETTIQMELPVAKSFYALSQGQETHAYLVSNTMCEQPDGYRTYRIYNEQLISYVQKCANDLSLELPFSSNNFYMWTFDYNLLSGKYPKYILDDGQKHYIDQYIGLFQGYPDVSGFSLFQQPHGKLADILRPKGVENTLDQLQLQSFYTFVPPQPELNDNNNKNFTIHQDSENEGVMMIGDMNVVEFPNRWRDLRIYREDVVAEFDVPEKVTSKQMLPSLWKITAEKKQGDQYLLVVNTAYDRQWNLYRSFFDMIINRPVEADHITCNGYANCFILETVPQKLYAFYAPERLNLLGWGITLASLLIAFTYLSSKRRETYDI